MTDFAGFFREATGGQTPYAYQLRLADSEWPDAVIAPTGLGKTAAVVLGWLWRLQSAPEAIPRRLVYCLPMRTLVEQTVANAAGWLARLSDSGLANGLPSVDDVHVLLGGFDEPKWYLCPERPAILIGTQDMLVSRALMRGYAMSRFRWPVDFALLHNDAQWVFDEVQSMGAALPTSTQLEAFRRQSGTGRPARSLWLSATLDPAWLRTVDFPGPDRVLTVPDDVPQDAASPAVRRLIDAGKPVTVASVAPAGGTAGDLKTYAKILAALVYDLHRPGTLTLAVLNTVDRARALHRELQALHAGDGEGPLLIHSRFRPPERQRQIEALKKGAPRIVVATQAVEAGVDISAATMVTELAPWSSLVQRFGRANRYGEANDQGGAPIVWVDLPEALAAPYAPEALKEARQRLAGLKDARPSGLGAPGHLPPALRTLRRKDLIDLFDTESDLTGFDIDISPYVRDADDTDLRLFWRSGLSAGTAGQPEPRRDELCPVPIGQAKAWLRDRKQAITAWYSDPQAGQGRGDSGWRRLSGDPWPGLTLMVDATAGGYTADHGFDPASKAPVTALPAADGQGPESQDTDDDSRKRRYVALGNHLRSVAVATEELCRALELPEDLTADLVTAARWHDVGKAHKAFQDRLVADDSALHPRPGTLLAKAPSYRRAEGRPYFRHELASALAWLAHRRWDRRADRVAYLIAAHHGKVRMALRALPAEAEAPDGRRFARGVWEGDVLPSVDMGGGETWSEGTLTLSVMELGEDETTGASWTERTRTLLADHGPFRLAWLEALLRIADWRASAGEEREAAEHG